MFQLLLSHRQSVTRRFLDRHHTTYIRAKTPPGCHICGLHFWPL